MNNSVALLYNFNEEKLKMIKMVCMMNFRKKCWCCMDLTAASYKSF